jgi:hypothetical protein
MAVNNGSTTLEFRDRNGNARRLTIRAAEPGIIQVLEGMISSNPTAKWITISVHESEPHAWHDSPIGLAKLRIGDSHSDTLK